MHVDAKEGAGRVDEGLAQPVTADKSSLFEFVGEAALWAALVVGVPVLLTGRLNGRPVQVVIGLVLLAAPVMVFGWAELRGRAAASRSTEGAP